MKTKAFFLTVLLCLYFSSLLAQREAINAKQCKAKDVNDFIFSKHPKSKSEYENFNKFTKEFVNSKTLLKEAATTYTIPVVVHVYGTVQHGKTVDYNTIKEALNALNKDFNGLNDDWNSIDPFFDGRKSMLNVRFALAKIDPNGGSTSGVIFHPEASGMGNYNSPVVARDGWDNYKYMNVYITGDLYGDGVSNNSGVAWYPNTTMSDQNIARVVYNGQYLHGNTDKEFASVFTHEFGHWLNLIHTFEGGCNDPNGDEVEDTPKEDENSGDDGCVVGASDCGNLINYENYMGYDSAAGCAKMYTQGQVNRMLAALQHPTRKPLWQPENLAATGVNLDGASLVVNNNTVEESLSNDGTLIDSSYNINIEGGTFTLSSGTLVEGIHYVSELPSGYSPTITVVNNTRLSVKFNGKANNHAIVDNTTGSITLKDVLISGGINALNTDKVSFYFSYYDPYQVVYVDNEDYTASASTTWTFFRIEGADSNSFGTFFENNDLKLETYQKALVCNSGTRNPIPIEENTLISSESNWVEGGAYPDLHVIRDTSYTVWDGKTAYIGFQLEIYPGKTNYGWFRIRVTPDGSSYSLLDYAYSTEPFGAINAGSKVWGGTTPSCNDGIQNGDETGIDCGGSCEPCSTTITYCEASNAGSSLHITKVNFGEINNSSTHNPYSDYTSLSTTIQKNDQTELSINVNNEHWTYNAVGVWVDWNNDGDFTDTGERIFSKYGPGPYINNINVPSWVISNTTLRMRVRIGYGSEDKITPCGIDSYLGEVEDYSILVNDDSGATCNDGIQNGNETGVDCGGSCDPCTNDDGVVYVDIDDVSVNPSNTWNFFRIEQGDDNGYGAWYTNNSTRLVTYGKNVICNENTNNITLIGEGQEIGSSSNFVNNPNSYIVSSSSYSDWNGKSGFIGFEFLIGGNTHYGWFHGVVANDGLSFTILDYAYQTKPNTSIYTTVNTAFNRDNTNEMNNDLHEITISPNPFDNTVQINVSKLKEKSLSISVYNILGQQLMDRTYANSPNVISFGKEITKSGTYFVKIKSANSNIVLPIVKQ